MSLRFSFIVITVFGLVQSTSVKAQNSLPDMVSHRAVYDLSLLKSNNGGPETARGRIVVEFSGSPCEGYVQTMRQVVQMTASEGDAAQIDYRSTTFESGDATRFRFSRDNKKSAEQPDKSDGAVEKRTRGILLMVNKPKRKQFDLPEGTLFPTEHMRKLIQAAQNGETRFAAPLFDGADEDNRVFDTVVMMGPRKEGTDGQSMMAPLANLPYWPMSMSFFEREKGDGTPAQIMRFNVYSNGVISSIIIDFGDFALSGTLKSLEMLKTSPCDKK
jgi:EipB-like